MTTNQLVLLGAMGWEQPAWKDGFYPAELPDDWLLPYYSTQFQAVFLPAPVWQAASDATWAQWLDDTPPGFHFVLEPASSLSGLPSSERVLLATPEWAAAHIWRLDEMPDLRALAQRITQHAATGEPLFVFSRSGNLALLEQVSTLKQVMGY